MARQRYKSAFQEYKGRYGLGRCGYCAKLLEGRRRFWCSDKCVQTLHILGKSWPDLRKKMIGKNPCCIVCHEPFDIYENPRMQRFLKENPGAACTGGYYKVLAEISPEVDHIKPVALYPELEFDEHNLQAMCARCHRLKTSKDQGHIARKDRDHYEKQSLLTK